MDLVLFMVPLLLSCIFFAVTVSYFVRDRESCFLLFVFASVPILFMSGISWPSSAIPGFWRSLSYCFPSTFGINGFVRLSGMAASLVDVKREYVCLWIQSGAYFLVSMLIYDGTFTGTKINGHGIFAEKLIKAGFKVMDVGDL